jgi:zinc D-Ala-D-Ala carboxypeptidase
VKGLGVVSVLILGMSVAGCQPVETDPGTDEAVDQVTSPEPAPTPAPEPELVEIPVFDTSAHSLDDPSSIWVVVNKTRPFDPVDYAPDDLVRLTLPSNYTPLLRAEAAEALEALFAGAESEGIALVIHSTYRSYTLQQRLKRQSVERYGSAISDSRSARAGHSEHQAGWAVDLTTPSGACTLAECFGETPEGRWLWENSWTYGFVLRYPKRASEITGYMYEPWHFRYVGTELSTEIWNQGYPTLEEFFGLPPAPKYRD